MDRIEFAHVDQLDHCFGAMECAHLLNGLLQLFEGGHPCDGVDEVSKRVTLFSQGTHRRPNGIFSCRAAGRIGVCSMERKVGLIQFAQQIPIFPEELPTLFHVGFGIFDFALCQ